MNEQEALIKFSSQKDVQLICLNKEFDRRCFKDALKEFYDAIPSRRGKRIARPSMSEVAASLIEQLHKGGVKTNEELCELINEGLFFKSTGQASQRKLLSTVRSWGVRYSAKTIAQVKAGNTLAAVKSNFIDKVKEEHKEEIEVLNEKVKKVQAEYDAMPSVLDKPLSEEELSQTEEFELKKSWWQRWYLTDDPFKNINGLNQIKEELYDQVVVQTKPFKEILGYLQRDNEYLFNKAFLLAGGHGFGKTTFLTYLSYVLLQKFNILSIRITCAQEYTSQIDYTNIFFVQLRNQVADELQQKNKTLQGDYGDDKEGFVKAACKALTSGPYSGVLIILDDYHKHQPTDALFGFLGLLQLTKDGFDDAGTPVGFFVAGFPEWSAEIKARPNLTGFLGQSPILMPEITPQDIVNVINQRIKAYSHDETPRALKLDFIRRVFEAEKKEGRTLSYRDYIRRVVDELNQNNQAIINSPVEIDEKTLAGIRAEIESNKALAANFRTLLAGSSFEGLTGKQVQKCIELLVQVHANDGVFEQDRLFDHNQLYFARLKDCQLIQKSRATHANYKAKFKWVLHKRFQERTLAVKQRFNYGLQDYLFKLYAGKSFSEKVLSEEPEGTDSIRKPIEDCLEYELSENVKSHLSEAIACIDGAQREDSAARSKEAILKNIKTAIDRILDAFFYIDETRDVFMHAGIKNAEDRLLKHWLYQDDETILEFYNRFKAYEKNRDDMIYMKARKEGESTIIRLGSQLLELCHDSSDRNRPVPYRQYINRLTNDDRELFKLIQAQIYHVGREEHLGYVEKVTKLVEDRLRKLLYVSTQCLFGPEKYFTHVDDSCKQYAIKNSSKNRHHTGVYNQYVNLTRGHYRSILVDGGVLNKHLTNQIMQWQESDKNLFFEWFMEHSTDSSHSMDSRFSKTQQHRYATYCALCRNFLGDMNEFAKRLVNKAYFMPIDSEDAPLPTGESVDSVPDISECFTQFCFLHGPLKKDEDGKRVLEKEEEKWRFMDSPFFRDKKNINDMVIEDEDYHRVVEAIDNRLRLNDYYAIDLLNIEMLQDIFTIDCGSAIGALAYAVHCKKYYTASSWFGSSIIVRRRLP
jgi:hypothetical protein